ncbi:DUF4232 domain-containing protein [Streptomyces sp. NPDC052309]|uniref:DUF4232 domain-containing protein n=1 Tax=Streptomyces sp. NPDC052309 TaxID=3155421 RepID=UPI0034463502
MRTLPPVAVTAAVAAALVLTACDDGGGDAVDDRGGGACRIDAVDVQVAASPAPAAGDTGTVAVTLTNTGSACTLDGFPTVTLTAGGTSAKALPDEAATAQRLTLDRDTAASFTLTYVRGEAGAASSLPVRSAEFALPGARATHRFTWSYGDVAVQGDGGGGPDATVGAFQRAGD